MPLLQTFANASRRGYISGAAPVLPPAYELISTQILGSNVSSVDFTSIPQTYKHLEIRYSVTNNTPLRVCLRFNGDTSSVYGVHSIRSINNGEGFNIDGSSSVNNSSVEISTYMNGGGGGFNNIQNGITTITDYSSTVKNKVLRTPNASTQDAFNSTLYYYSGLWANTSAVTSITIFNITNTQLINAGSRISLYGIKG
jgi:hypothetical protein